MPKPYFVYIIKAFGYYKIGKALNVERRVSQLQTAIPVPVELVLTIQTARHGLGLYTIASSPNANRASGLSSIPAISNGLQGL